MGKRIPKSIQRKVVSKWLLGKLRDQVAREVRISGGSVTNIIQSIKSKDREFDLLRLVALQLREQNVTVEAFAPLLRFRELIKMEYSDSEKSIEEQEENIESLMEALSVFCFNRKSTLPKFGNLVQSLHHMADKLGIPLCELPTHISDLAGTATAIQNEIHLLQNKKERLLKDYNITMDVINDILGHGPYILGAYQDKDARLREVEHERNEYKIELKNLKMEIKAREIETERKALRGRYNLNVSSFGSFMNT